MDLIIPKSIDGTIIKSISSSILSGKTFNSITISPNITSIGQGVLAGVIVNRLNLDYATGLTSLSLLGIKSNDVVIACSNNLTTIHDSMDSNIANLEVKNLKELKTIEENAFKDTQLTSLTLSNLSKLETIGANAFATSTDAEKKIASLTLSNLSNLTTIGEGAFSNQGISALTIKGLSNLKTIGSKAFEQNKISSISFDEMPNVTTIDNNAFLSNPLTSLDFRGAEKLTEIGGSAFASSKDFKTIDFSGLSQNINGTLVATTGTVDTLNFSNTGAYMTNFINNNISSFSNIKEINLNDSAITELILQSRNIETINLKGSSITKFTDSNGSNKISKLDFSNLSNLKTIYINSEENLSTLNVKGSTNLESITCKNCTKLTKINTIGLNNLNTLSMPGCQAITTVGISKSIPATSGNLLITSGASNNLTCVQIDGDNTRFNTSEFNSYFPGASTSVIKSSCNFD